MVNDELQKDELFIKLTIDGTEYEDIDVKVTEPNKTIREQIQNIVKIFELPKTDRYGNPRQYLLGQMFEDEDEPAILDFDDEGGNPQSLKDYNIKNGDHLHLVEPPLYGCIMTEDIQTDTDKGSVSISTDEEKKVRKPFWRHILYGS